MVFKLKPKEEKFFQYLADYGELAYQAADILSQAVHNPDNIDELTGQIAEIENNADQVYEKTMKKLNKTFITPFDREDIYTIAQKLDNFVDATQGVVERLNIYNAGPASDGAKEMALTIVKCAKQVDKSCDHLTDIKKNRLKLEARCSRIIELEAIGDQLYRQEMARLFRECGNPIEIIKWKELLEKLEEILDIAEDLANAMKKVVLKYA